MQIIDAVSGRGASAAHRFLFNVFHTRLGAHTKPNLGGYGANNNVLPGSVGGLPQSLKCTAIGPLSRMGMMTEVPASVASLASNVAAYFTGHNIRVDGGETRSV